MAEEIVQLATYRPPNPLAPNVSVEIVLVTNDPTSTSAARVKIQVPGCSYSGGVARSLGLSREALISRATAEALEVAMNALSAAHEEIAVLRERLGQARR